MQSLFTLGQKPGRYTNSHFYNNLEDAKNEVEELCRHREDGGQLETELQSLIKELEEAKRDRPKQDSIFTKFTPLMQEAYRDVSLRSNSPSPLFTPVDCIIASDFYYTTVVTHPYIYTTVFTHSHHTKDEHDDPLHQVSVSLNNKAEVWVRVKGVNAK